MDASTADGTRDGPAFCWQLYPSAEVTLSHVPSRHVTCQVGTLLVAYRPSLVLGRVHGLGGDEQGDEGERAEGGCGGPRGGRRAAAERQPHEQEDEGAEQQRQPDREQQQRLPVLPPCRPRA